MKDRSTYRFWHPAHYIVAFWKPLIPEMTRIQAMTRPPQVRCAVSRFIFFIPDRYGGQDPGMGLVLVSESLVLSVALRAQRHYVPFGR